MTSRVGMLWLCLLFTLFIQIQENKGTNVETEQIIKERMGAAYNLYSNIATELIKVSMTTSKIVTKMTKRLYAASDSVISASDKSKTNLTANAHSLIAQSVSASRCVSSYNLKNITARLDKQLEESVKCFSREADKGAAIEVRLTKLLTDFRGQMMEARKTFGKCTVENSIYSPCVNTIESELEELDAILRSEFKKLLGEAYRLAESLDSRVEDCENNTRKTLTKIEKLKVQLRSQCVDSNTK